METFNNLIQYQYEGNTRFVYALVRRKKAFERLKNLSIPGTKSTSDTKHSELQSQIAGPPGTEDAVELESASASEGGVAASGASAASAAATAGSAQADQGAAAWTNSSVEWKPTTKWLEAEKSKLALDTTTRLLQFLEPQIQEFCVEMGPSADENAVLEFLQRTTLVGLLPVPHAIVIRRYEPNEYTGLWFTTLLWGVVFLRNQAVPLFDGSSIRLFSIQTRGGDGDGSATGADQGDERGEEQEERGQQEQQQGHGLGQQRSELEEQQEQEANKKEETEVVGAE